MRGGGPGLAVMILYDYIPDVSKYYEARIDMITQIIRKHFFRVTDVHAIGELIPKEFLCIWDVHRMYLMEAPKLHKRIPA